MNLSAVAARVRVVAWILLLLLSLFPVLASVADLVSDFGTGLPADHEATFLAIAGQPWSSTQASIPAVAAYITLLETGYAIHELAFGILFLVIVAIPLRRRHWLHKASRRQARRRRALTNGVRDPAIHDARVDTYCKRQAIRDKYAGQIDVTSFNLPLLMARASSQLWQTQWRTSRLNRPQRNVDQQVSAVFAARQYTR